MLTKVGRIVDDINVYGYVFSENLRGWIKRRRLPGSHGKYKVKPPKARIAYCSDV